jgi:transglutaminase-like putative cysteine protease
MLLDISHITTYSYRPAIDRAQHVAYLRPSSTDQQQVLEHHLDISPAPEQVQHNQDAFGNTRIQWEHSRTHDHLRIHAQMKVRTKDHVVAPRDGPAKPTCEQMRQDLIAAKSALLLRRQHPLRDAHLFCDPSPFVPDLNDDTSFKRTLLAYAQPSFENHPLPSALEELMQRLHHDFRYHPQSTTVQTTLQQVWQQRAGVCQDFAHLFLTLLRLQGFAARYVSGYILSSAPEIGTSSVPFQDWSMRGADASHAWVEVCIGSDPDDPESLTWAALDPTNCRAGLQTPGPEFVRLATGRDYGDVAPVSGQIFSNRIRGQDALPIVQDLCVQVDVRAV